MLAQDVANNLGAYIHPIKKVVIASYLYTWLYDWANSFARLCDSINIKTSEKGLALIWIAPEGQLDVR